MTAKVGVLGGTFDPVHNGHLVKAAEALDQLGLSMVLFVVAGDPWMKRELKRETKRGMKRESTREAGLGVTPAHHRLAMVRLAVADVPAFMADDREVDRPGPTYSADTLEELSEPGTELYLLVGSDLLPDMPRWHRPGRVMELARVAVFERPGEAVDLAPLDEIEPGAAARAVVLSGGDPVDIGSTALRAMVARGRSVRDAVPGAVADYIEAHGLYGAMAPVAARTNPPVAARTNPPTPFQPWKGASGGSEAGGAFSARKRPQTP